MLTGPDQACLPALAASLRSCLRRSRLVAGPYDASPSGPDAAFAAEAARHPVFLLIRPPA